MILTLPAPQYWFITKPPWLLSIANRIAAHALVGALGGGAAGALGAGGAAAAAPTLDALQANLQAGLEGIGVSAGVAKAGAGVVTNLTAAGVGLVAGGGAITAAAAGLNTDANNRQLHPTERVWAKDNAEKYRAFLASKTGESISAEEAYQRLLSAGYAVTDTAASLAGKSDETAKQFIAQAAPSTLFTATPAQRANPFLGGNADGSLSPEQQARFGMREPATRASGLVTKAADYLGQNCGTNTALCEQKFASIDQAIGALNEARILYQNDAASVQLIDQQITQLKAGITPDELARGASASAATTGKNIAAVLLGNPGGAAGKAGVETAAAGKVGVEVGAGVKAVGDDVASARVADLNSQASFSVGKITTPIDFDGHVVRAEIKSNGNVIGGHSTATGDVQIVPGTASTPNAQGVYSAQIQVADPNNPGQFLPKTNNGGVSTMFPDSWTTDRIKVEVDAAFQNRTVVGNKWFGTTPSGVQVEGFLKPKTTVYPKL